MKAAFFDGSGKMVVSDHPDPKPGDYDAVVKVKATGICGSDLLMNNDKTEADQLPAGHEVAGEIVEIGNKVDKSYLGKKVAIETIGQGRACRSCWFCRSGQYRQCTNMEPPEGGGFAEFIKRKAMGCYEIDSGTSWAESALVEPLAVSIHGVRRGNMKGGDNVVILGAGTIGLTAVVAARQLGAGKIIVTARHQQQAQMALKLGADVALNSEDEGTEEQIRELTDGRGADLTIETVGGKSPTTLIQAVEFTRMQGRISILGGFRTPLTFDWMKPLLKEQAIYFSSCYGVIDGRHDYEMAVDMFSSKTINLENIVTHKFDLDNIQKGFECAYDKKTGSIKVQIHQ